MGEPIRPSTRATKQSGAAAAAAKPAASAAAAPAATTPAVVTPAAAAAASADASNDHSENSSHQSEDSWRASDTDVHRAPSTEERARAKELVDLIDGVPSELHLDGPEHRFVMQGKLSKQNPSGVWQSRQYLLFDDVLVWTKPNLIGKRSVFKGAIGVVGGELRQTPVGESLDTRLCFTVRGGMGAIPGIADKGKVYALKAATPGEKMTWVNAVRPLIARPLRRAAEPVAVAVAVAAPPAAPPVQPLPPAAQSPPSAAAAAAADDDVPPPSADDAASMHGSSSRRLVRPKSALIREALDIDEGTFASAVAVPKPPLVTGPSMASMDASRPPPLFVGGLGFGNHDTDSERSNSNSPLPSKREEELQPSPLTSPTAAKPPPPPGPPPKHVVEATLKQQSTAVAATPPHDASGGKTRRRHKRHKEPTPAPTTPDSSVAAALDKAVSSRRKKSRSSKKETAVAPLAPPAPTTPTAAPLKPSPPPTVRPLESEHDAGPPPPPPDSSFKIALRKSGNRADVSDLVAPTAPLSPLAAHALDAEGDDAEATTQSNGDGDDEVEESEESEEVVESDDDDDAADAADADNQDNARAMWSALADAGDKPAVLDAATIERMLSPPATAPLAIEADTVDEWQAKMQAQVAAKRAARAAASAPPVPRAPPTPPPAEPPAPPPRADEAVVLFVDGEWSAARDAAVESMRVGTAVAASAQMHTAARLMAAAVRLEVTASAGKSQAMKSKATRKAARLVRLARQMVAPLSAAGAATCDAKLAALAADDAGDAGDDGERWCCETFEPLEVDEAYLQCDRCASVFSATSTDVRLAPDSACVVCGSGKLAIVDGADDDDEE